MTEASELAALKPKWEGQFDTFEQWVNHATTRLAGHKGSVGEDLPAVCVDALGRRCHVGKDFMRARDEGAFPVRFFWECEAAIFIERHAAPAIDRERLAEAMLKTDAAYVLMMPRIYALELADAILAEINVVNQAITIAA